jgi:hexosaminidase
MQTLIQIIPDNAKKIPFVEITDYPRFAYRGLHLDVGRHMFPVAFIKKYIDVLAHHKMNRFHWHLTEDQGWRIEIKKYPKLQEIAAYRSETQVGKGGTKARATAKYDGQRYGGFYTQEEVKDIVKYAADRHVTVIPEIELPGHAQAALTAYPNLGCTGGPYEVAKGWGVFTDVYCAGKEETFTFLQDVFDEVLPLFPSKYIHIGGDECPKNKWKTCPYCQKRIKKEKLGDEHALQSYFIQRIEKYLNSKGRQIIGWDEILEGGLAPNASVMSWRGEEGGIAAAEQNHDVVMTPVGWCYFDYAQDTSASEPLSIGNYLPINKVYSYEPVPSQLNPEQASHILGAQANVWTEYMKTPEQVEYMVYPRASAMAEVVWSPKDQRDYPDFVDRMKTHVKRLADWKVNYAKQIEKEFGPRK